MSFFISGRMEKAIQAILFIKRETLILNLFFPFAICNVWLGGFSGGWKGLQGNAVIYDTEKLREMVSVNGRIVKKKPSLLRALQMSEEFCIENIGGKRYGKDGDWLVIEPGGYLYPVDAFHFWEEYEAA